MTDSTDTQALSSAPNDVPVVETLTGMSVSGYVVIYFPEDINEHSIMYGTFGDLSTAQKWAGLMTGMVSIHPVYNPTMNRG